MNGESGDAIFTKYLLYRIGVASAFLFCALTLALPFTKWGMTPSRSEVRRVFKEKEKYLNELVSLLKDNSVWGTAGQVSGSFPSGKSDRCYELMGLCGVTRVFRGPAGEIRLQRGEKDPPLARGARWGYAWRPHPTPEDSEGAPSYRHLDGSWYFYVVAWAGA